MKIIDDLTVVVYTSEELKLVLENNNGYNYIYFGNDITLSNGINISGTKSNLTIDGTYENIRYKYTDMKSLSTGSTIQASNKLISTITIKNMDITGYNYYGVIYVPDSSTYKNIVVEYNNITYIGPQISFHPFGLTRFIDSNIIIQENYATGNEVAECNKIEIGGKTTILHKSTANTSFWFRNEQPSLKILKNAYVLFTSESRELLYGVTNLEFVVEENAYFEATVKNGFSYGTYGTGTSLIDKNATFKLNQTSLNGSYSTWYSYGSITLDEDSNLIIINDFSGINTSTYNINFMRSTSSFILNNPKYVLLYNKVANIINSSNTIDFNFTFSRLNLFSSPIEINDAIDISKLPTYSWYKKNDSSNISGTFNSTNTAINSTNFTEEELSNLPNLTNMIFANKKILSIGSFQMHINPITDESIIVSGKTSIESSILIEYNNSNIVSLTDGFGNFSHELKIPLKEGDVITFTAKENNDLIYKTKKVTIVYSGELTIVTYPEKINFTLKPANINPLLLEKSEDIKIKVIDSRITSSNWKLYATISNDLTDKETILPNSIVYLDNGKLKVLSQEKTLIYQGKSNDGKILETDITIPYNDGILAAIEQNIDINKIYTSKITWILEE